VRVESSVFVVINGALKVAHAEEPHLNRNEAVQSPNYVHDKEVWDVLTFCVWHEIVVARVSADKEGNQVYEPGHEGKGEDGVAELSVFFALSDLAQHVCGNYQVVGPCK
jgi:hypothetical protein